MIKDTSIRFVNSTLITNLCQLAIMAYSVRLTMKIVGRRGLVGLFVMNKSRGAKGRRFASRSRLLSFFYGEKVSAKSLGRTSEKDRVKKSE